MKLNDIGIKHGTDKSTLLSGYLDKYEKYIDNPKKVNGLLEIGLKCGSAWKHGESAFPSLMMWREYFPKAAIFGADIKPITSHEERITVYNCDQSDTNQLKGLAAILPKLDIIIDDGSHKAWDQQISFKYLNHLLPVGGIYVIEDLQSVRNNKKDIPLTVNVLKAIRNKFKPDHHFGGDIKNYEINIYDCLTCKDNISFLRKIR
jgi:hypothetical protein